MVELKMYSNRLHRGKYFHTSRASLLKILLLKYTYSQLNRNIIAIFTISYLLTSSRLIESSLNYRAGIIGI